MKKMNKKAFTLIELLAVFVVLAIIALITVPIVLKIISNSKSQSEKNSILGYAHAAENGLSDWEMMNPGKQYTNYDFSNINTKGNNVSCQNQYAYSNGKIALECCSVSGSNKLYNYIDGKLSVTQSCSGLNETYELLEIVKVYNEDYLVIGGNDSSTDYLTLLKKESIGSSAYYTNDCPIYSNNADISNCSSSYGSSLIKPIVNTWATNKFHNNELKTVNGYSVRLFNEDDLDNLHMEQLSANVRVYNSTDIWSSYLSFNTWTMISVNNTVVNADFSYQNDPDNNNLTQKNVWQSNDIHPVINIKKQYVNQ